MIQTCVRIVEDSLRTRAIGSKINAIELEANAVSDTVMILIIRYITV